MYTFRVLIILTFLCSNALAEGFFELKVKKNLCKERRYSQKEFFKKYPSNISQKCKASKECFLVVDYDFCNGVIALNQKYAKRWYAECKVTESPICSDDVKPNSPKFSYCISGKCKAAVTRDPFKKIKADPSHK